MGLEEQGFTLEKALGLQWDLLECFEGWEFQEKMQALFHAKDEMDSKVFQQEYRRLILDVQVSVLPKHGFPGNQKGVMLMIQALKGIDHYQVHQNSDQIERAIDMRWV